MKIHRHIINTNKMIVTGVAIVIVPCILFILLTSRTSFLLGIRSFDVVTGSMEPQIHVGSIVFVRPEITYKVGDVITFTREKITITHRIIAISGENYKTKGDANKQADAEVVKKYDIIGKNILTVPYIGLITNAVKTIPGFIIIIVFPSFLFIAFELHNIKKEWEREIEKKIVNKVKDMEKAI